MRSHGQMRQGVLVAVDVAVAVMLAALVLAPAGEAAASPITARVSFELDGSQRTGGSSEPKISADGRVVAYDVVHRSDGDNGYDESAEVYAYDLNTGKTDWISAGPGGSPGYDVSTEPSISADGRFVAFASTSNNLVPGDTDYSLDVFVRDRRTGGLERITDPRPGGGLAYAPSISPGGRYLAFVSFGPRRGANGEDRPDVLLHDRQTGKTALISPIPPDGFRASEEPSVSAGGRYVAFVLAGRIQVRDRVHHRTESIPARGDSESRPSISASGRFVAFTADTRHTAQDFVDPPGDVFVYDRESRKTSLVSVTRQGRPGNGVSGAASISPNGRYVAFGSRASNLVPHDTNGVSDAFVRDLHAGTTRRVSISSGRNQGNGPSGAYPVTPDFEALESSVSGNGTFVAFPSAASNLVPSDTNGATDIFVRGPLSP